MPKFQCAQCDNDHFENLDGFYYCSVCNMKLQVSCVCIDSSSVFRCKYIKNKTKFDRKYAT